MHPDSSGMDVRASDGPVPPPGGLLDTASVDRALAVDGAGEAHRILYSTIDQHGRPAVSTAVVFTPKVLRRPGDGRSLGGRTALSDSATTAPLRSWPAVPATMST